MSTNRQTRYKKEQNVITRVRSWTIGKSPNKGTRFVRVTFENYISWTGWDHPNTKEKLMETLKVLGFKGAHLGMLANDDALNKEIEVSAALSKDSDFEREYKGKFYYTASFVNKIYMGGFSGDVDQSIINEFAESDCRAYINNPIEDTKPAAAESYPTDSHSATSPNFSSDDIPW